MSVCFGSFCLHEVNESIASNRESRKPSVFRQSAAKSLSDNFQGEKARDSLRVERLLDILPLLFRVISTESTFVSRTRPVN